MNVLLTGGEGTLGVYVASLLESKGHVVEVLDIKNGSTIAEPEYWLRWFEPDAIVHLAHYDGDNPFNTWQIVSDTNTLLACCAAANIREFIYVSVLDPSPDKYATEMLVHDYEGINGMDTTVVQFAADADPVYTATSLLSVIESSALLPAL